MARIAVVTCAAVFSLASCASGGSQSDSTASDAGASGTSAKSADRSSTTEDGAGGGNSATPAGWRLAAAALQERRVERRGSLTLTSTDVEATRDKLLATVDRVQGYVADERSRTSDDGTLARTKLTLVVPTDAFDTALAGFGKAATVVSQEQTAKDVTEQVVDVQSRVESAEASLRRIRVLLSHADKLGDVIQLETVLSERQADLESLQAQRQSLAARTDTATIEVDVRSSTGAPEGSGNDTGFLAGLSAGWAVLRSTWAGFATAVGAVLPLAVVLGVPAIVVVRLVRRVRRRHPASPPTATP